MSSNSALHQNHEIRSTSRASQRFSRVFVLDKAIDALAERHEQEGVFAAADTFSVTTSEAVDNAKTRLSPSDRGTRAYLYMLAAFIIEAIMWGKSIIFLTFSFIFR
jgi:hypothetical protein